MTNKICFESRNGHLCNGCDGEWHQWFNEDGLLREIWRAGQGSIHTHGVHKEIGHSLNRRVGTDQCIVDMHSHKRTALMNHGRSDFSTELGKLGTEISGVPLVGPILGELVTWFGTLVATVGSDIIMDALRLDRPIHDITVEIGEPTSIFDAPSGTILDGFIGGPVITWDDNPLISDTFDRAMPSVTAYDRNFERVGSFAGIGFGAFLGELVEAPSQSITMYDREIALSPNAALTANAIAEMWDVPASLLDF